MELSQIVHFINSKYQGSDVARRIASGAFWSLCGTSVAKALVLISGILCARILGKEAYGEFGIVRSTITMFVVLGGAGLGATATKYISEYRFTDIEHISSIYILTNYFAFILGFIVSTLVFLFSDFFAETFLHAPHLESAIKIGSLLLFVSIINGSQNGVLSGFEDFKSIAINTLIGSIFESLFMVVGAIYYGVNGAVLGFGMGFFALLFVNSMSIRSNIKNVGLLVNLSSFRKEDLKLLYRFSIPAALASFVIPPTFWIIKSLLVRYDGFSELAVYEAADHWRVIILFVPTAVGNIVLPILSSINVVNPLKFWKLLKVNLFLNASIAFMIAIIICIFSKDIMFLYGKDYTDNLPLVILAISTLFSSMANVVGLSITSRAKMWIGFFFNLGWGVMVVLFSLIFLERGYGAVAISLAILIAYFFHTVLQLAYLAYSIKSNPVGTTIMEA